MAVEDDFGLTEDSLCRMARDWSRFLDNADRRDLEAARESDINERGAA